MSAECNVEDAEDDVMDLRCKVILLEWFLTLLLNRIKRQIQFIHGCSAIPDFVSLGEIEIRGFLCHYFEGFLRQKLDIVVLFLSSLRV